MSISTKKSYTGTEYSRIYSSLGGVDFTGDGSLVSESRFSYLENMYRDYEGEGPGVLESIPGFRKIISLPDRINAIFSYKSSDATDYTVIHAGASLYRFKTEERDSLTSLSPIAELADTESRAFIFEDSLYVLDGERILRLDGEGNAAVLGEGFEAYVPITYYNGEPYEQRNLLSEHFTEKYNVSFPDSVAAGSAGLVYRVTDAANGFCTLSDGSKAVGAVYIPSRVTIDGVSYLVTEISPYAFSSNLNISIISIPEGLEKIGNGAFSGCTVISKLYLPSTVKEIGRNAFSGCIRLNTLYLGAGLSQIGEDAFKSAPLGNVHYPLDEENYAKISGVAYLASATVSYKSRYTGMRASIPVYSHAESITDITLNGESVYYDGGPIYTRIGEQSVITAYEFTVNDKAKLIGASIEISGVYHKSARFENGFSSDFFTTESGYEKRGAEAICKCRVCESFDGRIFLAANPSLPNTVFYTARDRSGRNNPTYFGVFNYFTDGSGKLPVTSLLATGDSLAVFKAGDDGGGSIYYHEASATGDNIMPKVYPVSYIHRGFHSLADSACFFDDPVFISSLGLSALDKKALYLERSIACRSHNVNARLLTEKLEDARLAKWCGYLAVSVGGNLYLADSRATFSHPSGSKEYEWYFVTGVGTYRNTEVVYRYSPFPIGDCEVNTEKTDEPAQSTVFSEYAGGSIIYFTKEEGKKYALYKTSQTVGGDFFPATRIYSDGNLLFFGTECGDVCVFNNDKRAAAPERIRAASVGDAEEYSLRRRDIHPEFYSFDSRAPRYAVKTKLDNCSLPHLSKDTVRSSLTLKLKSFTNSRITLEVGTDRGSYKEVGRIGGGELSFTDIDFSSFTFESRDTETLPFKEKEKRWTEKEIAISSEDFCSPIGIYSIAYRFTVRGKIKIN